MKRPNSDPFRKALFREVAREIVAKDRYDRKHGLAVDTGGAIARAMERAYRQGFEDAQLEPPANHDVASPQEDALEWALIPPRPRNTFWTICLFSLGTENIPDQSDCYLIPVTTKRGTPGWQLIQPGRTQCNLIFGHQTFIPLARLGLFDYEDRRILAASRYSLTEPLPLGNSFANAKKTDRQELIAVFELVDSRR